MTFAQACLEWAIQHLGAPYIWAGQGEWCGRKDSHGDIQVVGVSEPQEKCPPGVLAVGCPPGVLGVDCAGFVKRAVLAAGGPDVRAMWGAQHLFWHLPEARAGDLRLAFYGSGDVASHVEFDLGNGLRLGANGGDSTTLTYAAALKRDAKVRLHLERRGDCIGFRSLEAMRELPRTPPPRPAGLPSLPPLPTRST